MRTRLSCSALLFLLIAAASDSATAEEVEVWHGWMNLIPCSTVEWRNDGIFGTPSPTVVTGPQELHGHIFADIPNGNDLTTEVQNACIQCGIEAAAVTTAVAILTEGTGGWEAFTATFWDCIQNRTDEATQNAVQSLRISTETMCT
jgi:hypothetical protein